MSRLRPAPSFSAHPPPPPRRVTLDSRVYFQRHTELPLKREQLLGVSFRFNFICPPPSPRPCFTGFLSLLLFQLEQAWWFYEDFIADAHRHLPHFKLKVRLGNLYVILRSTNCVRVFVVFLKCAPPSVSRLGYLVFGRQTHEGSFYLCHANLRNMRAGLLQIF